MESTISLSSTGPEKPTLIERVVGILPVPYPLASLAFAILFGSPVQFLAAYLDTNSVSLAFKYTINTSYNSIGAGTVSTVEGATFQGIWLLTIFLLVYLVRFMRTKIVEYEPKLVAIAPSGEETLHRAFGGISRPIPQALLAVPFLLISLPYISQSTINIGPVSLLYQLVSSVVFGVMFSSFIWLYFRSLWGLYKLGKEPLNLRSHYEDRMLGVKPIGAISLTLFVSYTLVIGLTTVSVLFNPDPIGTTFLIIFAVFGVAMFFIPLNSIHRRMAEAKQRQMAKVDEKFARLADSATELTPESTEKILKQLRDTQILMISRDYVSNLPTWPLDTPIIGRFAAVALSVAAILISKIVSLPFHI